MIDKVLQYYISEFRGIYESISDHYHDCMHICRWYTCIYAQYNKDLKVNNIKIDLYWTYMYFLLLKKER